MINFVTLSILTASTVLAGAGLPVSEKWNYTYRADVIDYLPSAQFILCGKKCPETDRLAPEPKVMLSLGASGVKDRSDPVATPVAVVHFRINSSALDKKSREILDGITPKKSYRIEGFTCPLGRAGRNRALAKDRAEAVSLYLKKRGIITVVQDKGNCCYIPGQGGIDYQKSRRVEIREM